MIIDEERREVAARLRAERNTQADMSEIWSVLDNVLLTGDGSCKETPWDKTFDRLADLIEPSCDRSALLALADEIALECDGCRESSWAPLLVSDVHGYADRIREACGAEKP